MASRGHRGKIRKNAAASGRAVADGGLAVGQYAAALRGGLHNRDGPIHGGRGFAGGESRRADHFRSSGTRTSDGADRADSRARRTQRGSLTGSRRGDSLQQSSRGNLEGGGVAGRSGEVEEHAGGGARHGASECGRGYRRRRAGAGSLSVLSEFHKG